MDPEGGGNKVPVRNYVWGGVLALLLCSVCLAEQLRQGPFLIDYHPADRPYAGETAQVLEETRQEFAARLPMDAAPVRVVIAGTLREFVRLAGSFSQFRVSGIARPAEGLIAVQSPRIRMVGEDYHGTLRHELLHVLLYRNTDTDALPRWLNEGLCMSYANEYHWQNGLAVAHLFLTGRVIPIAKLDSAFTLPGDEQVFGDAYAMALSVTHHMRARLGEDTFWNVVLGTRHESFEDSLQHAAGMDESQLWANYHRSLWLVALIGAATSGSLLGPASVLAIVAWWRIRGRNRRRLAQMATEEQLQPPLDEALWRADDSDEEDEEDPSPRST